MMTPAQAITIGNLGLEANALQKAHDALLAAATTSPAPQLISMGVGFSNAAPIALQLGEALPASDTMAILNQLVNIYNTLITQINNQLAQHS